MKTQEIKKLMETELERTVKQLEKIVQILSILELIESIEEAKEAETKKPSPTEIKTGDMVVVIDGSRVHAHYEECRWLDEYSNCYVYGSYPKINRIHKVLKTRTRKGKEQALIQDTYSKQVFVIDSNGIKKA